MLTITSNANRPIHVTAIDGSKHRLSAHGSVTVPGLDQTTKLLLEAQGFTIATRAGSPQARASAVPTMPGVPVAPTMPGVPTQPALTMPGVPITPAKPKGGKGKGKR